MSDNAKTGACPICGAESPASVATAVSERFYCRTCFHGWRPRLPEFNYAAAAMCSLGTATERQRSQIAFIAPFLAEHPAVLEIGCASGEFAASLRHAIAVRRYDAIELSPIGEKARPHLDRLHVEPLGVLLEREGLGAAFDLIIMSHILEHLEYPGQELSLVSRVLTPGGTLFIEVPNRSGHPNLPLDDNVSHLHFFSPASLLRLLADHSFEVQAVETGARLDARYADSLRVVARRFAPPQPDRTLLSFDEALAEIDRVVVWGAGSVALEVLANFLDPGRIEFFIDKNPTKHGSTCLGRPIKGPAALGIEPRTVLIASVDFGEEIAREIDQLYPGSGHTLIRIADVLDRGLDRRRR